MDKKTFFLLVIFILIFNSMIVITTAQDRVTTFDNNNNNISHLIPTNNAYLNFFIFDDNGKILALIGIVIGFLLATGLIIKYFLFGQISRSKSSILANDQRMKIYKYIQENPGSNKIQISQDLNLNIGSIRYHLYLLKMGSFITEMRDGKNTRLFHNSGILCDSDKKAISVLRHENKLRILEIIVETPGINGSGIAQKMQMANSTISWYMDQLLKDGFIVNKKISNYNGYYINKEKEDQVLLALGY